MALEAIVARLLNYRCSGSTKIPPGLYLGTGRDLITGEARPVALSKDAVEHSFVFGRTGSGKTTLLAKIFEESIRLGNPFLDFELHGPAIEQKLAMLGSSKNARPKILLEPAGDRVVGWNPLSTAGEESPYPVVQDLISIFSRRIWADSWGPRLEEVLRNTLLPLCQKRLTLLEAHPFLTRPDFRRWVLAQTSIPEVREFWTLRFERLSPSQRSLITETVLNKLSVFHDPAIKYVVGQEEGTLDLDRALSERHTITANLSSGRLSGNYLLASLLVAKLKQAVYRRRPGEATFAVFLDEFQELVALDALEDFLRSFRKFGCATYLATQHLDMPSGLKAAIFGNCSRFFAFAASATDAAFFARELGGNEASLVAELLPELKRGEAIFKERGRRALLLKVQKPRTEATREHVAEGRAQCLQLGFTRSEIDQKIEERSRRFRLGDVPPAEARAGGEEPEGYEGF